MLGPKTDNAINDGSHNQQAGGNITGVPPDLLERMLCDRETSLRKDFEAQIALLERATAAEKAVIQVELELTKLELAEVRRQLANPEQALAEKQPIIASLEEQLTRRGNDIGGDALAAAKAALESGDFTAARNLFEGLSARTQPDVQAHADTEFALGQIAEAEIRWNEAAGHYTTAARMNPTFSTLVAARASAWRAGNYPAALRFGEDLLQMAEQGGDQQEVSVALNEHALTLKTQGHYAEAETLYTRAVGIFQTTVGDAHANYATLLNNLAGVVWAQGRNVEAEELYTRALEIDRASIGEAHPDFAIHLNNLAALVKTQGRYAEAEGLYTRALEIDRASIGESHPSFAIRLNNLAGVMREQGRYVEAEELYTRALEIDRASIGEAHPDFAIDLNNLASLVEVQGRYAEAEGLYQQALGICRTTLGDQHPNTLGVAGNYLDLLQTHNPTSADIAILVSLTTAPTVKP